MPAKQRTRSWKLWLGILAVWIAWGFCSVPFVVLLREWNPDIQAYELGQKTGFVLGLGFGFILAVGLALQFGSRSSRNTSTSVKIAGAGDGDSEGILDAWLDEHGFQSQDIGASYILYRRGFPYVSFPHWVQVSRSSQGIGLETWIQIDPITRLFTLFLLPATLDISPKARMIYFPRRNACKRFNQLLASLGQPPLAP